MALAEALKLLHKEVTCINEGEFETEYAKMFKDFFKTNIEYKDYDLYIIVDTSSKSRIGNLEKDVDFSKLVPGTEIWIPEIAEKNTEFVSKSLTWKGLYPLYTEPFMGGFRPSGIEN